jgi:hypothetical protein
MDELETVAPVFVALAHSIVWCAAATVDLHGRPRSRVLHPVWEWDGERLTGWIATSPQSPKGRHLAAAPFVSCTYWTPTHDTATAECRASWEEGDGERERLWQRFLTAPAPVGYDPRIVPGWDSPASPMFGSLRMEPWRLSVMPGSVLLRGEGRRLAWQEPGPSGT